MSCCWPHTKHEGNPNTKSKCQIFILFFSLIFFPNYPHFWHAACDRSFEKPAGVHFFPDGISERIFDKNLKINLKFDLDVLLTPAPRFNQIRNENFV